MITLFVNSLDLVDVEKAAISLALKQTGGNRSAAARLLNIDRRTLYRKLQYLTAQELDNLPAPPHYGGHHRVPEPDEMTQTMLAGNGG